jgi:dienelactone hydrolase
MASVSWTRPSDGATVPGFAFGTPGAPGVVCLQEWWGVVPALMKHAQKIVRCRRWRRLGG